MEKRTIIAFVLSFLVLLLWSTLFSPKEAPKPPKAEPEKRLTPTAPSSAGDATVTQAPVPPQEKIPLPTTEQAVRELAVETPLYKLTFTNAGAAIKSVKLKNYRVTAEPRSPLVELSHMAKEEGALLEFSFEPSASREDEPAIYHVTEDFLTLGPESPPQDLTFTRLRSDGVLIQQTYRIYPDRYPMDLTVTLSNKTPKDLQGSVKAVVRNLPPEEKQSYYAFMGVSLLLNDDLEQIEPKKIEKEGPLSGRVGWMAYEDGYFMTAVIPEETQQAKFSGRLLPSGALEATYTVPPTAIDPDHQLSSRFTLYLGPRDLGILKSLNIGLDRAINFGWTDIIAKPLLYALRYFNKFTHNYGLSIIILTLLIKILFWPLTHKSYKSMKEMQKLQPLMAKIREKHKGNKEQMNRELMGLYKTYKVNPMGGCLPMIIQIPVFFALFRILGNSIELRHAPFMLWINDLSAPDRLFSFPFSVPFMSPPYGIPVLTLLMGASMFIQQKMTPTPGDPAQAKIMMFLPIIFTVMFINFPSGLVLYWLVNNVLSIGQQYRIIKKRSA